jgi:hypothetical protein
MCYTPRCGIDEKHALDQVGPFARQHEGEVAAQRVAGDVDGLPNDILYKVNGLRRRSNQQQREAQD